MKKIKQLARGCGGLFMGCGGLATAAAISIVVLLLLGWLVWPTLYRHETVTLPDGPRATVRIHRITGEVERLGAAGWEPWPAELAGGGAGSPVTLPSAELTELGDLQIRLDHDRQLLRLFLFNGSRQFAITTVGVKIRANGADGRRLYEKVYPFYARDPVRPAQSGELICLDAADLFSALAGAGEVAIRGEALTARGFLTDAIQH
ncbi:MAG: hypothetical protein JXQ27_16340 [Acidobacteria bacterium]|nr:hypothetical protein [Acidobacteriota bacterium]